jgi:hypothetical protein
MLASCVVGYVEAYLAFVVPTSGAKCGINYNPLLLLIIF